MSTQAATCGSSGAATDTRSGGAQRYAGNGVRHWLTEIILRFQAGCRFTFGSAELRETERLTLGCVQPLLHGNPQVKRGAVDGNLAGIVPRSARVKKRRATAKSRRTASSTLMTWPY